MKNIGIAIRSLFKRGQHNVMKIISLGIGLTIGLVLIAKVHFENLSLIHISEPTRH